MDQDQNKILQDYYDFIEIPKEKSEATEGSKSSSKEIPLNIEKAFEFANSCRDKEIDRFWTRGLYFWGFIVASFTSYFAVFSHVLENDAVINMENILGMSFTAKCILFIISLVCFIFCLSWLLVHKGSKFWQQNWEEHVSYLEASYIGKIYNVYLNTDNKRKFSKSPFCKKGYDFSVSKISFLCSLLLVLVSFCLLVFNGFVLFFDSSCNIDCTTIIAVILVVLALAFVLFYWINSFGGESEKTENKFVKIDLEKI